MQAPKRLVLVFHLYFRTLPLIYPPIFLSFNLSPMIWYNFTSSPNEDYIFEPVGPLFNSLKTVKYCRHLMLVIHPSIIFYILIFSSKTIGSIWTRMINCFRWPCQLTNMSAITINKTWSITWQNQKPHTLYFHQMSFNLNI